MKTPYLFLFILFISCNNTNRIFNDKKFRLKKSEYVIFNQLDLKSIEYVFNDVKNSQLNDNELFQIEDILKIAVRNYKEILKDKRRQYVPVINKKGEKEVWINFFCSNHNGWKEGIIIVLDGGKCYAQIKINLTKNTFSQLVFNGEA